METLLGANKEIGLEVNRENWVCVHTLWSEYRRK